MGTLSKGTGAVAGISQRQGRYKRSAPAFLIILAALVLLLGFSMVLSVCIGIAGGSFKVFAETVMSPAKASGVGMIMLEMRMPRALAAGLTGMAFALSGAVMQGITRNPLSDAGLLGINAGAGFFVALSAILFPAAPDIVKTCAAFAGAALAVFMVYGFGAGKHRSESFRFILAGAAVSALLTALSQAVSLAFGIVKALSFWSAGSLSGVTWQSLKLLSPVILSASALGLLLSSRLSALALGEDSAASLGVNVRTVRLFGMEKLSGGQQQRAWIAMALAQKTGLLFLDEPTTYLDISHQLDILYLLRRLNRENGVTIVMVLHDLNHAIMFSDYLVAIKDGTLHSAGTPQEVITQQALREIFDVEAEVITHPVLNVPVCLPFRITEQNKKTGGSNT